jgi:3-phenylpropionate/cinnamic acid dioxygenase small subunit
VTSDEAAITNLLYRYAELLDAGLIDQVGEELFRWSQFVLAPPPADPVDGPAMVRLLHQLVIIHDDGTPRTRHVITNPIVDVHHEVGAATCRSYYTVFQQTPTLPLQAIVMGRYHDRFSRVEGEWAFTERDYTMIDMVGDLSQHLTYNPKQDH